MNIGPLFQYILLYSRGSTDLADFSRFSCKTLKSQNLELIAKTPHTPTLVGAAQVYTDVISYLVFEAVMTSPEQTQQHLQFLAIGILQQEIPHQNAPEPVSQLNPYIQRAWAYICWCMYLNGEPVPGNIAEFVTLLHTPIESWPGIGEQSDVLGLRGAVLDEHGLTAPFRALGEPFARTYRPLLELEDERFRQIFQACKDTNDGQSYSAIRLFLIRHPLLHDLYAIENPVWNIELTRLLLRCYEPLPVARIRGSGTNRYVVTCPHCSWPLVWNKRGEAFCHRDGPCAMLYHPLAAYEGSEIHRVAYQDDMVCTREGVQRFVVAPEVALIQIYDTLSSKWNVQCELFPALDSYDLRLTLPDGRHWAIDVKDWHNPVSLAFGINDTPFRALPAWDAAFYVFPDYRATPAYRNLFANYWHGQRGVIAMPQGQFIRDVRKAVQ